MQKRNEKNKTNKHIKKVITFQTTAITWPVTQSALFIIHTLPFIPEFCMRLSQWWMWMAHGTNQAYNDMHDCENRMRGLWKLTARWPSVFSAPGNDSVSQFDASRPSCCCWNTGSARPCGPLVPSDDDYSVGLAPPIAVKHIWLG